MSQDFDAGLDGLQGDMAAHQRRFGREVTAEANQAIAAQTIARLDREADEAKPGPTPTAPAPVDSRTVRDGKHGRYVVDVSTKDDIDAKIRPATKMEHEWFIRAMPRVTLLLGKPETGPLGQASWRQRTLSVLKYAHDAKDYAAAGFPGVAKEMQLRYVFELEKLLDESSAPFGDWRKLTPQAA